MQASGQLAEYQNPKTTVEREWKFLGYIMRRQKLENVKITRKLKKKVSEIIRNIDQVAQD